MVLWFFMIQTESPVNPANVEHLMQQLNGRIFFRPPGNILSTCCKLGPLSQKLRLPSNKWQERKNISMRSEKCLFISCIKCSTLARFTFDISPQYGNPKPSKYVDRHSSKISTLFFVLYLWQCSLELWQGGLDFWKVKKIMLEPTATQDFEPRSMLCLWRTFPKIKYSGKTL